MGLQHTAFGQAEKLQKQAENRAKKAPESGSFSCPLRPFFGMVSNLSLGVLKGSPKHKPNIGKDGRFRAFCGTESGSANRAVEE
jgi:hypothetical protein